MRTLVLLHDNRLMMASITAIPIRARILEWPEDDAELFAVWEVPTDYSHLPPADITEQFALTWALEYRFGDGIDVADVLAPFPAFIRVTVGDKLMAKWRADMTAHAPIELPNPLRRAS